MEINISKNSFRTMKSLGETDNTVTYDWDIIVPDSKPDIKRVIAADGVCFGGSKEIMQDRAVINGNVALNIIYEAAGMNGVVKAIESNQSFSYIMELSGLEHDVELYCLCRVKKIKASVINSRKLNIICTLEICGDAMKEEECEYVEGVEGEGVEYLSKEISASRTLAFRDGITGFDEIFEIPSGKPSAEEILKTVARINGRDIRPLNGKLLCKGEIAITVIYNGENEGDGMAFADFTLPFTEMFDGENLTEGCCFDGDIFIENLKSRIVPDNENERRAIGVSADIRISGKGYENITINAVTDAYGRDCEIEISGKNELSEGVSDFGESRITVKEIIDFPGNEGINKVINIIGREYVKSVSSGFGKVNVDGGIVCDILYNSSESDLPVSFMTRELPFRAEVIVRGAEPGAACRVRTEIISISYSIINSSQLEIRVVTDISVHIKRPASEKTIGEICISDSVPAPKQSGITVCFWDGKEELWDIAKKYKTTVSEIMKINNLNGSELASGAKLIIP